MSSDDSHLRIEVDNIKKRFGTVEALSGVSLNLRNNEVLGLVGDNGAGKSTLIKTLVGIHQPDEGEIRFDGEAVTINGPKHARSLGIGTVYQDPRSSTNSRSPRISSSGGRLPGSSAESSRSTRVTREHRTTRTGSRNTRWR